MIKNLPISARRLDKIAHDIVSKESGDFVIFYDVSGPSKRFQGRVRGRCTLEAKAKDTVITIYLKHKRLKTRRDVLGVMVHELAHHMVFRCSRAMDRYYRPHGPVFNVWVGILIERLKNRGMHVYIEDAIGYTE
ncbi:SprT-like family protein [uncultured archaeon]|nr:SprT-like family protein [uncultured archaeon]